MSEIFENAFQIARYLYDNKHTGYKPAQKDEIRDLLNFSPEDFDDASEFLCDQEYCEESKTGYKDAIWTTPKGILYVDRLLKERVSVSRDAENLLKHLVSDQTPDFPFSLAESIMDVFKWSEDRYMEVAQELGDNNFVRGDYAEGNPFFKISMTPEGRKVVRNNFHSPNLSQSSLQIVGSNNIVNISSTLNSVNQFVQANSYVELSSKQELEKLLRELETALKEVPNENADDAEAVASMAKNLIESATREKPNKPLVQISADGLKRAAENIAAIAPKVLLTAQAVIVFIKALHPSLLP